MNLVENNERIFVGLKGKTYSYLTDDSDESKKTEGKKYV